MKIFNIRGEEIITLFENNQKAAGVFEIKWDGTNSYGQKVANGIYIYRLQSAGKTLSKKMIMLK